MTHSDKAASPEIRRRLWGRSISHPLSSLQKELLVRGMATYRWDGDDTSFLKTFPQVTLEIGFGDGEHILEMARANPEIGFIGGERFLNGVVKVLSAIEEEGLPNIRLFDDDVNLLLDQIPDHSLKNIYVLFPDPWPKKRHRKRRLLNREFMTRLHEKLSSEGQLFMASDIEDYRDFIKEEMAAIPHLYTFHEVMDAPRTKYCRKAENAGRVSHMFCYKVV